MRKVILAAGALACLSLTACEGQVSQAEATPAEAPKKSLARPAPMYAGQAQVLSIQSGDVELGHSGGLNLSAKATAPAPGWTAPAFLPRIYAAQPADGIYEVDVIATAPAAPGAEAPTPIDVSGHWNRYSDGRVKGIKFMSKTNEVTVMVPAPAAAAGG